MKFVFLGTPEYVLPILDALNKKFKVKGESPIAAVVTQEPKPTGRNQFLTYSPVDDWAHKRSIPIYFDPEDIIKNSLVADMGILASYGKIIPESVIKYFKYGILNVHPSCLPKYRGASPIQASLISQGKITLKKQNDTKATFTRQIKKEDAFIPPNYLDLALKGKAVKDDWTIPFIKDFAITPKVDVLDSFIRAMSLWPFAWTTINTDISNQIKRIKIMKSHLENNKLILDEVQMEGKSPVTWRQFKEGYPQSFFKS